MASTRQPSTDFNCFARFYDADYRDYNADLQMVSDLAQEVGGPLLELGCGTGRALLPLAAIGHQATGVDISPALLSLARQKLEQAPFQKRVTLVEADLRTFSLSQDDFSLSFCISNTLMHLTTQADQLAALRNAHRHLRGGGHLLLDLFNPDVDYLAEIAGMQELADQWVDEETGVQVLKWSVRRLDLAQQWQETLFVYEEIFPDGRLQKTACPFTLRFLWPSEGELMLQMAGFHVEAIYGDFDGNPYASDSERLIFLARKE